MCASRICQNNNFIFMCTNELEYENQHLLPEKGGVRINRVYELLEILWYYLSHRKYECWIEGHWTFSDPWGCPLRRAVDPPKPLSCFSITNIIHATHKTHSAEILERGLEARQLEINPYDRSPKFTWSGERKELPRQLVQTLCLPGYYVWFVQFVNVRFCTTTHSSFRFPLISVIGMSDKNVKQDLYEVRKYIILNLPLYQIFIQLLAIMPALVSIKSVAIAC